MQCADWALHDTVASEVGLLFSIREIYPAGRGFEGLKVTDWHD